jgi:small GTP-binding protein
MLAQSPLDFNVAIIGNVSVGKSTLLNALLRAKYSEVSMKRTTAGVNYFRLHQHAPGYEAGAASDWSTTSNDPRTAASVLTEITQDNAILRSADEISEKYFDLELPEPLFDMHPDVRLVLVDIPGINEARMGSKYKDYLSAKWCDFDCVLVIMDAKQGVNTDDQLDLLKFVKQNQVKRSQPVIVLCNKVDDPDDSEQAELVIEARREVEKIFKVTDRVVALDHMLSGKTLGSQCLLPAFMPISAGQAYFLQTISLFTLEQFRIFDDKGLVEKYGRDHIGRHGWSKMSDEDKLKAVFDLVRDFDRQQEGLEISNYHKFLRVFSFCVGVTDNCRQLDVLADRVMARMYQTQFENQDFVQQIEHILLEIRKLSSSQSSRHPFGQAVENVKARLLHEFKSNLPEAMRALKLSPEGVVEVSHCATQLGRYARLAAAEESLHGELPGIVRTMSELVKSYVSVIAGKYTNRPRTACSDSPAADAWSTLLPSDWQKILEMVLLASSDRFFCHWFPRQKIQLEMLVRDVSLSVEQHRLTEFDTCRKCGKEFNMTWLKYRSCGHCRTVPVFVLRSSERVPQECLLCEKKLSSSRLCSNGSCKCLFGPSSEKLTVYDSFLQATGYNFVDHYVHEVGRVEVPETISDSRNFGNVPWQFCQAVRDTRHANSESKVDMDCIMTCAVSDDTRLGESGWASLTSAINEIGMDNSNYE